MELRSGKRSERQVRMVPSASAALPGGSLPFRQAGCRVAGDDGRRTFAAAPITTLSAMLLRPAVLLVTALLGLTQCMREGLDPEDRLPDATQTGQNTAGCRVDGRPWRAVQTSMFAGPPVRANLGPNPLGGRQLSLYLGKFGLG